MKHKEIKLPKLAITLVGVAVGLTALAPQPAESQDWTRREFPLAPTNSSGNFVAPFFDGWYRNPDGTVTLSFGYSNLNLTEVVEIPVGPDNFISPAEFDGRQPTFFEPPGARAEEPPTRRRRNRGWRCGPIWAVDRGCRSSR